MKSGCWELKQEWEMGKEKSESRKREQITSEAGDQSTL